MRPNGEYRESHPGDTWAANHTAGEVASHHPAPAEGGPYDTCQHCGQPIRPHYDPVTGNPVPGAWVTMLKGSAECYGNR